MELYPPQQEGVDRGVKEGRFIYAADTGAGKTPMAISTLRSLGARRILVAAPALARTHWLEHLDAWWPEHPPAAAVTYGRSRNTGLSKAAKAERDLSYEADIQVVSYQLLEQVDLAGWDAVIWDESHRLKNPKAVSSVVARNIMALNQEAFALDLTATLMPDQISDVWHQLDLLWRGRFGNTKDYRYIPREFLQAYCNAVEDEYAYGGYRYEGLNQARAAELRMRLDSLSHRITKAQLAAWLPPFTISVKKVKLRHKATTLDDWTNNQFSYKESFVNEWIEDAFHNGTHICVLTHLRETAELIGNSYRLRIPTYIITGDMSPEERVRELRKAQAEERALVVATMHSVGISIDLTWCTQALFAELYWRPETVIQAAGRFSRLSGKLPSSVDFLVAEGTVDEAMAKLVLQKLSAITQVSEGSPAEKQFMSVVEEATSLSDDEAISLLNEALEVA